MKSPAFNKTVLNRKHFTGRLDLDLNCARTAGGSKATGFGSEPKPNRNSSVFLEDPKDPNPRFRAFFFGFWNRWNCRPPMAGFFFFSYRATGMGNLVNSEGR